MKLKIYNNEESDHPKPVVFQENFFRAKVTPQQHLDELRRGNSLYGVSIGSSNKSSDLVRAGYEWTTHHFDRCAILLGDSLFRITLKIQKGLDPSSAVVAAQEAGNSVLATLIGGFETPPEVFRCSDIMRTAEFGPALHQITKLFDTQSVFRGSIRSDAFSFVERQSVRGRLAIDRETAIDLAIHYLHEEIAVYLVLAEQGWLIDVYIGHELPTLARIIDGNILNAPEALRRRINVSLRPR